jgi:hypothetical protein
MDLKILNTATIVRIRESLEQEYAGEWNMPAEYYEQINAIDAELKERKRTKTKTKLKQD